MHQGREISQRQGFDPSKERHLIWSLRRFISDNKKKSLILKDEYLAGQVFFAVNLLHQLENTRTFRGPLSDTASTLWYCWNCGDLDSEEVTSDDCCSICGNKL